MELEHLIDAHAAAMLHYAQMLLKRRHLAEDAVQEAFFRWVRRPVVIADSQHMRAWLITVTGNVCRDMLKSPWNRLVGAFPDGYEPVDVSVYPEEEAERRERNDRLFQAVMKLPVKYREPVLLVYYYDMDQWEAAQAMKLTESTFRTRLMRARGLLKDALGEEMDG